MGIDHPVRALEERPRGDELLRVSERILREVLEEPGEFRLVLNGPLRFRLRHDDASIGVVQDGVLRDPVAIEPRARDHRGPRATGAMQLDRLALIHVRQYSDL